MLLDRPVYYMHTHTQNIYKHPYSKVFFPAPFFSHFAAQIALHSFVLVNSMELQHWINWWFQLVFCTHSPFEMKDFPTTSFPFSSENCSQDGQLAKWKRTTSRTGERNEKLCVDVNLIFYCANDSNYFHFTIVTMEFNVSNIYIVIEIFEVNEWIFLFLKAFKVSTFNPKDLEVILSFILFSSLCLSFRTLIIPFANISCEHDTCKEFGGGLTRFPCLISRG